MFGRFGGGLLRRWAGVLAFLLAVLSASPALAASGLPVDVGAAFNVILVAIILFAVILWLLVQVI